MDPVMQTLFGKMPIEQLNAVQSATQKNKNSYATIILGSVVIILGITAYLLYLQNVKLKKVSILKTKVHT